MTPNAAKRLWFQQKVCFEEKFVVQWSGFFFDIDSGAGGPLIDLGELHRSHFGIVVAAGLFRIVISMAFT